MIIMAKRCVLWLDGSLFFRGILKFFDLMIRFFSGSLLIRLFTADFDRDWLRQSFFVRLVEDFFNRPPKILSPPYDNHFGSGSGWFNGSAVIRFLTDSVETPIPSKFRFIAWLQWFTAAFPVWGLLAVVAAAPFLPTMIVAGMLIVVFVVTLFRYDFELDLVSVPLLLFMGISLFSGFTSVAPSYSIAIAILTVVMMSAYLLIKTCFNTRERVDFAIAVFILAAGATTLEAFYQVYAGYMDAAWVDRDLFAALGTRVFSTFANPNVYGTYLLLALPLAAVCVLYARNIFLKLCAAGITGMLLIALALTYSRGAYVSLAVAVLVFLILIEKRLIVLFVAGLAAMPFVLPASIIARIVSIVNFTDTSTMYRISIWQASLRMLGDFWTAGIGQGAAAYNSVYPFYAFSAVTAQHSHNWFLQIFLETGIVGFLAFLMILACFFRLQFSFMRNTSDWRVRTLSAAITAAVVGFLVQGLFDHSFHNYRVMLVFYLFLGLGVAVTETEN